FIRQTEILRAAQAAIIRRASRTEAAPAKRRVTAGIDNSASFVGRANLWDDYARRPDIEHRLDPRNLGTANADPCCVAARSGGAQLSDERRVPQMPVLQIHPDEVNQPRQSLDDRRIGQRHADANTKRFSRKLLTKSTQPLTHSRPLV